MTTIGTIKLDSDGSMTGEINTLRFSARVRIIPNARRSESSPDFRIYAGNSHLRWQGGTRRRLEEKIGARSVGIPRGDPGRSQLRYPDLRSDVRAPG